MPVKRLFFLTLILVASVNLYSQQQTADIGLFGGGATPFTDYSKMNLGQSIKPNFGAFYRYNFNSRYSLRVNALYGTVGASGEILDKGAVSFSKDVLDLAAIFEVNYLDFLLGVEKWKFSPYVHYGIGLMYYTGANSNSVLAPNIVLGTGAKYALSKRLAVGAEITSRKLTNDELDNQNDPFLNVSDFWHNNDWINYYGVTLTYKFFWGKKPCPAYNSLN